MTIGITGPDALGEYARAVEDAGGTPRALPNDVAGIDAMLASVDGIVLSGGHDVHPAAYHRRPDALVHDFDEPRDTFELALARELRKRRLPTLAICRGLQLLNVAYGGTLVADLPRDRHLTPEAHQPKRDGETLRSILPAHIVSMEDGLLANALGRRFPTTSRHHQAIDRLAPDLRVVGRTADHVIEAVEANFDHPWFAAVQWHPETSAVTQHDTPSRNLFKAFVRATTQRK